jgi:hemerythrin-like domain-containing protein
MSSTNISHPFFQKLMGEHREILSELESLKGLTNLSSLKGQVERIWELAEQRHHHNEEFYLFSRIYLDPRLLAGGPMCSLYFDVHMSEGVKEQVERIIGGPLKREAHQEPILQTKCPLTIPIEEHQASKSLLDFILKNIDQLEIGAVMAYLELYKKIQFSHIQKEDNCLFHLCSSLLTSQEADQILEQWNQTETKNGNDL